MTKACNVCQKVKPITEFYKEAALASGIRNQCKECKSKTTAEWRERNRDKYNADMRAYRAKHYEKLRLYRYGITLETYHFMLREQNNCCKICEKAPSAKKQRSLVVDHCHTTGRVRGLLCYGCNRAIVILDNQTLLKKALEYLKP